MKRILSTIAALTTAMVFQNASAQETEVTITNDCFWLDNEGHPIYSQGGGIFRFPDPETHEMHYYWYGAHYAGAETYYAHPVAANDDYRLISVTCYRSDNLKDWEFIGDVFSPDCLKDYPQPEWLGRLGVAYLKEIRKYVLVIQYNKSVLFALCDTPTGLFKPDNILDMTPMIGTPNTGDQTVFIDDDGTPYLCYSYGNGRSKSYISTIGVKENKVTLLDCHCIGQGAGREGNCMFRYQDKYYVCASDLYGWNASNVYYYCSNDIFGPYEPANTMALMPGAEADYGHVTQTGFFFNIKGKEQETVVYCGDRWCDFAGNGVGYNQWFPVSFNTESGNVPVFNSWSEWVLNPTTGNYRVGIGNNWVRNGSFEADRKSIPSDRKPAQDFLRGWTTEVIEGNIIQVGSETSPKLNGENSVEDRKTVIGNWSLNISDNVPFKRSISQNIQCPAGTYHLSAYTKVSGKFTKLELCIFDGNTIWRQQIPTSESWQKIEMSDILVHSQHPTISIEAHGESGAICYIDDITFTLSNASKAQP